MGIQSVADASRVHHQWNPNKLRVEADYPVNTATTLLGLDHQVEQRINWSLAHKIIYGGADYHRNQDSLAIS